MNKQPKAYSFVNKQLEEDSMCPTMILTGKSQHLLFNQVLEYTAVLWFKVEIINCRGMFHDVGIVKLCFNATGSMLILGFTIICGMPNDLFMKN